MNTGNPGQRLRGPSNGTYMGPGPGSRPTQDQRNVSSNPTAMSNGNSGQPEMSRAEKFEDEKKRIIESCFGKKEQDGSRKSESGLLCCRL